MVSPVISRNRHVWLVHGKQSLKGKILYIDDYLDYSCNNHQSRYRKSKGFIMEDNYADRYGAHLVRLIDRCVTMKEFEFDQTLLMPTAAGYRALIEQAKIEIKPKIKNYLLKKWPEKSLENFFFFAMAVAVYGRSISDPPYLIDIGKVLLRTVASCNLRCVHRMETGGGCRMSMNNSQHYLPKCIKLPRDIDIGWSCVKKYIATGKTISAQEAISLDEAMSVKVDPGSDFAPATSC